MYKKDVGLMMNRASRLVKNGTDTAEVLGLLYK